MICLLIVERSSGWLHVLSSGEVTCPTRVCRPSGGLGKRWYIPNVHTWPPTCRYADLRPTVPSHSPHPNQQKALWKKVLNYSIPEDSIRIMKSRKSVSLSTIWGIYHRIWGNNRFISFGQKKPFPSIQVFFVWYFMLFLIQWKTKHEPFFLQKRSSFIG